MCVRVCVCVCVSISVGTCGRGVNRSIEYNMAVGMIRVHELALHVGVSCPNLHTKLVNTAIGDQVSDCVC